MKTQNMLRLVFSVAAIALLLLVVPCEAANPSALVGRWVLVEGPTRGNPEKLELLADRTGVVDKAGVTWKTEKDRFYITASRGAEAYDYKLSGSTLTLTKDDGTILKYTKCNKDCKATAEEYEKAAAKAKTEKAVAALKAKATKGSFTDSRDGKTYKTVKLDKQTWMAENLNYNASGSKCYDNNESNCKKYGRLYDWKTAKTACPKFWHLPSEAELDILANFVDGDEVAGNMLKTSSGWNDYKGKSGNGLDAVGFSGLPGGYGSSGGSFRSVGNYGYWWSTDNDDGWFMGYDCEYVDECEEEFFNNDDKNYLFSVRCIKD